MSTLMMVVVCGKVPLNVWQNVDQQTPSVAIIPRAHAVEGIYFKGPWSNCVQSLLLSKNQQLSWATIQFFWGGGRRRNIPIPNNFLFQTIFTSFSTELGVCIVPRLGEKLYTQFLFAWGILDWSSRSLGWMKMQIFRIMNIAMLEQLGISNKSV